MKTSELTGAALDWAVAKCEGWRMYVRSDGDVLLTDEHYHWELDHFNYSTDWSQGGPIIEREGGTLWLTNGAGWGCKARYDFANYREGVTTYGPTPLIAAMRCYVASKLGDEVDVPEGLQ